MTYLSSDNPLDYDEGKGLLDWSLSPFYEKPKPRETNSE